MTFADIPRNPSPKTLRQFSVLCVIFFGGAAIWQYFVRHRPVAGLVLAILAVGPALAGLINPAIVRRIFVGYLFLVFPISWTVSNLLLAGVFYLLVAPMALLMRLFGRDLLRRRPVDRETLWEEKPAPAGPAAYLKQY
jgi:hypothetical protein